LCAEPTALLAHQREKSVFALLPGGEKKSEKSLFCFLCTLNEDENFTRFSLSIFFVCICGFFISDPLRGMISFNVYFSQMELKSL
jgi:hypothetical protein